MVINTNSRFSGTGIENYASMNRRLITVPMTGYRKNPKEGFLEGLAKAVDSFKFISSQFIEARGIFIEKLKKFDLEALVFKYKDSQRMEMVCDPLNSFIVNCLEPSPGHVLPLNKFLSYTIFYLLFREGSTIEIKKTSQVSGLFYNAMKNPTI